MNMGNNKLKRHKPQMLSRRTTQFWSRDKVMALGVAALLSVGGVVLMSATSAMAANSSIGTAITRDDVLGDGAYQVGEVQQPSGGGSSNRGNGWYDVHEKDPVGGDEWYDVHETPNGNSNDGWYDVHEKEPTNENGWYDVTERPSNDNDGWYDVTEIDPPGSVGDDPAIKNDDVADLIPPAIKDDDDNTSGLIPPAIKDDNDNTAGLIPPAIRDDDDVADLIPPAIKGDDDTDSSSDPTLIPPATLPDDDGTGPLIPPATLPDNSSSSGGGTSSGGSSGSSSSSDGGSASTPSNPSGDKPSGDASSGSGDSEQPKPSFGFVDGDSGERDDFGWSASATGDATIVTFHWRFDGGAWQQCNYADAKDEVEIPSYALVMEAYVTDSDGNDSEHVFWDIIEHMQVSSFRNDTVDVSGDLSGVDTSDANGADTVDGTPDDEKGDANNGKLNSVRDMTGEYSDDVTTTTEVVDDSDDDDVRSDVSDTDDASDDSGNSGDGNGVGSDNATSGAYVDDVSSDDSSSDTTRTYGTAHVDGNDEANGYSTDAYDTGTSSYEVDENPLVQTGASAMVGVPVLSGIAVVIAAIGRKFRNMR